MMLPSTNNHEITLDYKFAYLPTKMSNGTWIWLKRFKHYKQGKEQLLIQR